MPRNIVVTDQHVYLNEHDISAFVVSKEIDGEKLTVVLHGNISDKRSKPKKKKQVKNVNR